MGDTNQDDKNTNETADNAPAKKKDWTAADLVKVSFPFFVLLIWHLFSSSKGL